MSEAIESMWGVPDPRDLPRATRAVALQKVSGALLAVEDVPCDLAFTVGQRGIVALTFSRFFAGVALHGPPWRLDPTEDLPSREEWLAEMSVFL